MSERAAAIEEAAKLCERRIREELEHGRLQARSILYRAAKAIRALSGARADAGWWGIRHVDGRWRTLDTIGMPDWTNDPNEALCFRLREHASRFAEDDPADVRIVAWQ